MKFSAACEEERLFETPFIYGVQHSANSLGVYSLDQQVPIIHDVCLATRKEVYTSVGGFSEVFSSSGFTGADYSLRVNNIKKKVIWTAHTIFECEEELALDMFDSKPKAKDVRSFKALWHCKLIG